MRFKTLLVCFLAVCAVSLTSCKKEKNENNENNQEDYTKNFVGSYDLTLTSTLSFVFEVTGQTIMLDSCKVYDGGTCDIVKVGDSQNVKVALKINTLDTIVDATCNENGMLLSKYSITEMKPDESGMNMGVVTVVGATTVPAPADGKLSWTSDLSGEVIVNYMGVPSHSPANGTFSFEGTKK